MDIEPPHKRELSTQLSSSSLTNFKSLTRRRLQTVRKISRVKHQAMTEKYIKSMNENAQNGTKRKSERMKLMKFLWKDVKSRETDNLNMTLDYDVVDLRELDPEGTLLKYAVNHNFIDVIAVLLRHSSPIEGSGEDGLSPLHLAVKLGHIPALAMILANNPPINVQALYEKRTPLHVAVRTNSSEALDLLLQHGADPNKPDIYGSTPLHLAARLGRDHLIKLLIEHGASVQAIDNEGWTPMHIAAEAGHASTGRILLQNHSIVDAQSKYGKTPLHWACKRGHLQVVQALLDHDANPGIRDRNNKLAIDYTFTPLLRTVLESYTKKPDETPYVPRTDFFDCRLRNKSLIDLVDLEQFKDAYAHRLNIESIGRGAMRDENSKSVNRAKSMPFLIDSCNDSESTEKSTEDIRQYWQKQASIKSSLSFASFTTVSESEIDFAMGPQCESIPVLSLTPIMEEPKNCVNGNPFAGHVNFTVGDSGYSDSSSDIKMKSGTNSPYQSESEVLHSDTTESQLSIITNGEAETQCRSLSPTYDLDQNYNVTETPEIKIHSVKESISCNVPVSKLIQTMEVLHERVDNSVDENVVFLNDVFRDVNLLRQQSNNLDQKEREKLFNNVERNIMDIVVRLKELKVKFDNQIFDI